MSLKNKKGFDTNMILSVVAAVAALFILVSIVASFLDTFKPQSNQQIALDNAFSMSNFITSSKGSISGESCFDILKISNLESYQADNSQEKRFSYILSPGGVSVIYSSSFKMVVEAIEEGEAPNKNFFLKNFCFSGRDAPLCEGEDETYTIKEDKTTVGNTLKQGTASVIGLKWGQASIAMEYGQNIDYLILHTREDGLLGLEGQNSYNADFIIEGKLRSDEAKEPKYLIFDKANGVIMVTENDVSSTIAKSNVCVKKDFTNILLQEIYTSNPKELDEFDRVSVLLGMSLDGSQETLDERYRFEWKKGEKICYQSKLNDEFVSIDCNEMITQYNKENTEVVFDPQATYDEFIDFIDQFYLEFENDKKGTVIIIESEYNKDFGTKRQEVLFEEIFEFNSNGINMFDSERKVKEEFKDDIFSFKNKPNPLNGILDESIMASSILYEQGGSAWFYLDETHSFSSETGSGQAGFYLIRQDKLKFAVDRRENLVEIGCQEMADKHNTEQEFNLRAPYEEYIDFIEEFYSIYKNLEGSVITISRERLSDDISDKREILGFSTDEKQSGLEDDYRFEWRGGLKKCFKVEFRDESDLYFNGLLINDVDEVEVNDRDWKIGFRDYKKGIKRFTIEGVTIGDREESIEVIMSPNQFNDIPKVGGEQMKAKKSQVEYVVVGVLISLIAFFVTLNFLVNTNTFLKQTVEDTTCSAVSGFKSFSSVKAADYFKEINFKCKKDEVKIKYTNQDFQEDTFRTLGNAMYSCWKRYGEGQSDFMSNIDTTGRWCFTCARIEFEQNPEGSFEYYDFITWAKENKANEEETYYDSMRILYGEVESEEHLVEVRESLDQMRREIGGDADFQEMIFFMQDEYQSLLDLTTKRIDTSDNIYVVYRYDRLDRDGTQLMLDVGANVALGTIPGTIIGAGVGFFTGGAGTVLAGVVISGRIANFGLRFSTLKRVLETISNVRKFSKTPSFNAALGAGAGGAAGGAVGVNSNPNHLQYVDVMSREQYYRTCGFEPLSVKPTSN